MSQPEQAPDPDTVVVLCNNCGGDGWTAQPTLAILNGQPQTVISRRECPWCRGNGRRKGFQPPV
ncbi:hypothetical protein [Prauserella flavalba]|uniref:hypothetical protein n=1 Tax=Prauserella flavalba TaxID=1477506 RepID=UPI0036EA398D